MKTKVQIFMLLEDMNDAEYNRFLANIEQKLREKNGILDVQILFYNIFTGFKK